MADEGQTQETTASGAEIAASLAQAPDEGSGVPPADVIRESPEYKALQEQNRTLARQAGTYRSQVEQLRAQTEAERQAAEAQRVQATQQAMLDALGPKAPEFGEFAQLLQTDPVAAARRFAEMGVVQSPLIPETPAPQTQEAAPVSQTSPPPTVSANVPLGQSSQQTKDELVGSLDAAVANLAKSNANLQTRARVTDRLRATAVGQFIRRQYVANHDIDPELTLNPNDNRGR